ncbi:MAG TPA: transglycosylase domain-containing protein [Jatrophihabitans sp.]|jgi:membrane peptidoglycan carboxypeptidase
MAEKKPPAKKAAAKKAPAKAAPAKKAGASIRRSASTQPPRAAAKPPRASAKPPRASAKPPRAGAKPPQAPTGWRRWWAKRTAKRQAKKARLAKLPLWRRIVRRVLIVLGWLVGIFVVLLAATLFLYYRLGKVPSPDALPLPQSATIEYSDGTVMARVGEVDRTSVPLSQVPDSVKWAVLAAEDRKFYSEPGFSVTGTARAALSDVFGGDTQGGSGITQQYVKNAYLTADRTLGRKLKELMISVKLSHEYPKDEILEYYLNTVYFGRGVYGVQAAASAYFGEDVSKLTVSQGALLAGLLKDPGDDDPATDLAAAQGRWNYVLDGMVATKHLTAADRATEQFPTAKPPKDRLGVTGPKALIVQRVVSELGTHGISENEVNTRGLVIRTTISRQAQSAAESAITQTYGSLTVQQRNLKNALVAVDPGSGGVVAYYGGPSGPDYAGKDDYFDYAGLGARPAGSSFKPYTLASVLTQTFTKAGGKKPLTISSYVDGNYCVTIEGRKICNDPGDEKYSAKAVKIADAMKYSLNTSFDLLAQAAGPDNVAALAHTVGIATKDSNGKRTLVDANGETGFGIGIGDYPVSPLDQAVGYATFADGGTYNKPYFVKEVTTSSGDSLYLHKGAPKRVLAAEVANDVTLSLEPIAAWSNVPLTGRVSAAKTGTVGITGSAGGDNSDAWMVGFTPQVAAAVWTGSGDSTTPIYNQWGAPEYGSDLPGHAWQLFMNTYLAGRTAEPMPTQQQIVGGTNMVVPPVPSTTPAVSTGSTAGASPSVTGSPGDSGSPAAGTAGASPGASAGGSPQPSG